jgi:hypothetical protein
MVWNSQTLGQFFEPLYHQWHHQWHCLLSDVCIFIFASCKQNTDDIIKGGLLMESFMWFPTTNQRRELANMWFWQYKLTNGIIHVISTSQSGERSWQHVILDDASLLMVSFMWFPSTNQRREFATCDSWRCKITNGIMHVISVSQSEEWDGLWMQAYDKMTCDFRG